LIQENVPDGREKPPNYDWFQDDRWRAFCFVEALRRNGVEVDEGSGDVVYRAKSKPKLWTKDFRDEMKRLEPLILEYLRIESYQGIFDHCED
jgi:hypothetical protein